MNQSNQGEGGGGAAAASRRYELGVSCAASFSLIRLLLEQYPDIISSKCLILHHCLISYSRSTFRCQSLSVSVSLCDVESSPQSDWCCPMWCGDALPELAVVPHNTSPVFVELGLLRRKSCVLLLGCVAKHQLELELERYRVGPQLFILGTYLVEVSQRGRLRAGHVEVGHVGVEGSKLWYSCRYEERGRDKKCASCRRLCLNFLRFRTLKSRVAAFLTMSGAPLGGLDPAGWKCDENGEIKNGEPQCKDEKHYAPFVHSQSLEAEDVLRMKVVARGCASVGIAAEGVRN